MKDKAARHRPVCAHVPQGEDSFRELVVAEDERSCSLHRALFSLHESCYRLAGDSLVQAVASAARDCSGRMHVAVGWMNILRLALWRDDLPPNRDVRDVLRRAGLSDRELFPFREADVRDFFPWLYYGKRLDVLRKVCNIAKAMAETRAEAGRVQVICHLTSDESPAIVASSL